MHQEYRLINDFKYQTQTTIWKLIDAMALNYAVYSSHQMGLPPYLSDFDVYLYCDNSSMVVVCIDCCGQGEDQTYAESETLSPLILGDGHEPRVSKVWKLAQTVRAIQQQLEIPVYGLLMTEADITNACELYSMWSANNIMVYDDMKRLKCRKIRVNDDDSLPCKAHVDAVTHTPLQALPDDNHPDVTVSGGFADATTTPLPPTEDTAPEEAPASDSVDEFERLLKVFLGTINEETLDQQEEEEEEQEEQEEEEEEEEETPEDTDPTDDTLFPDGEIEQYNNHKVKVQILRPIANPREELDRLVGCDDIKQRMNELVNLTTYNKMLSQFCPTARRHEVSLHSLFLGRPGTGKTTVCKIYGSLLRQVGALSKGHVVVCDRGTFIGPLWSDEERSTQQVVDMAQGGVLMIDEAYLLNSGHASDPGKMVIQLLMKILADETQRDIAVVLCGYKEPMKRLLDLNPGLQSRFPNRFEFHDFTVDELLEITRRRIQDYDYTFTHEAWDKYVRMLTAAYQQRDPNTWGNARFIANQLERIYLQHASRCVRLCPKNKSTLLSITPEDIVPIEIPRPQPKIGF